MRFDMSISILFIWSWACAGLLNFLENNMDWDLTELKDTGQVWDQE